MPRIFDNIDQSLLPALCETLALSDRADFCVGYFNLRGSKQIGDHIERWSGGPGHCCRLLVGMQRLPQEDLRDALSILSTHDGLDNQTALRLKQKLAEDFRQQLMLGVPTNEDEAGLRRLAAQIKAKKSPASSSCGILCTPSCICSSGPIPSTPWWAISAVAI